MSLHDLIEAEAAAANRAAPALNDDSVAEALRRAAWIVSERQDAILLANAADCKTATGRLDEGTLDRLRLDESRVEALARQLEAMADV
jgi:glutamate-5-semialdehyde dehydrogenase